WTGSRSGAVLQPRPVDTRGSGVTFREPLHRWRNWHTRQTKDLVPAMDCGFKSRPVHQNNAPRQTSGCVVLPAIALATAGSFDPNRLEPEAACRPRRTKLSRQKRRDRRQDCRRHPDFFLEWIAHLTHSKREPCAGGNAWKACGSLF